MHTNYVIYTPGRTGSHIILEVLTSGIEHVVGGLCNCEPYWHTTSTGTYDVDRHRVIHTHDLEVVDQLNLSRADTVLILSQRHNKFASIMSMELAHNTGEYHGLTYSAKHVAPITVDIVHFIHLSKKWQQWPGIIAHQDQYKKIVSIDYEDIVNQSNPVRYIADKVGVEYCDQVQCNVTPKNPRQYQDYITNWVELKEIYHAIYTDK